MLSLDATVVLLTPVLIAATGASLHRSHAYASVRIANSGSMLLPVSNLTNLLVFSATGLSFVGFAWAMLPVWLVAVPPSTRAPLVVPGRAPRNRTQLPTDEPYALPLFPVRSSCRCCSRSRAAPRRGSPRLAGAILLGAFALVDAPRTWRHLLAAANLPFAVFVLLWALVVTWLGTTDFGDWFGDAMPIGAGLGVLIVMALIAMVAANLVNNLPATLLLLPGCDRSARSQCSRC